MTTRSKIISFLDGIEQKQAMLLSPDYDDAIIGLVERLPAEFAVAYDISRVIDCVIAIGGPSWTRDNALSYFEECFLPKSQNQSGPIFVDTRFAE